MNVQIRAIVFGILALGVFGAQAAPILHAEVSQIAQHRPDLNAFLNRATTTTAGLIAQARADDAVMDRYQRHYAMNSEEVIQFLGDLHPARLAKEGVYTIYSVPINGVLRSHLENVKVGTPIFADPAGRPILIMKCGNPMSRGPKSPESDNGNEANSIDTEKISLKELTDNEVAQAQRLFPTDPMEPGYSPVQVVTPETTGASPIQIAPTGGGFNLGPLGLGLAVLGIGLGNKGPAPVPEPSTLIAVAMGGIFLASRLRKRD